MAGFEFLKAVLLAASIVAALTPRRRAICLFYLIIYLLLFSFSILSVCLSLGGRCAGLPVVEIGKNGRRRRRRRPPHDAVSNQIGGNFIKMMHSSINPPFINQYRLCIAIKSIAALPDCHLISKLAVIGHPH